MTRFIKTRNEIKSPKKSSRKENSSQISSKFGTSGSDITMCEGGECPFKGMCHRYTAEPDGIYQSYFTTPPYKINKGKPECEMFWGDAAQQLFIQLKEIVSCPLAKKKKQR